MFFLKFYYFSICRPCYNLFGDIMKKVKEFIKNNKYLWITLFISLLLIGIVFGIKGIYPFGSIQFNIYDFDHAYVPVYYKLWDLLHGSGQFLFDWNLGTGLHVFGSLVSNSLWMPSSLIIGLFSRSFVPYAMSYVVIFKLLTVVVCTYIALSKIFPKIKEEYKVFATILYTFSGWTAFMLSSLLYLDVLALFPLFVLAYYRLLKDNKWGMYVIVLTMCLLLNYYMSWLILFFIIGITIISLLTLDIKEKKKKAVLVLLLTLLSLGLSCILFLPSVIQALTSYRMDIVMEKPPYLGEVFLKIVYMLPMAIPIFFTVKQFLVKKDKRINLFFGLLLIYLLAGVFIQPINAMWHTGSYSGLPFRYAFIPSFILILSSLYYLDNNFKEVKNTNKVNIIVSILLMVFIVFLTYLYREEYLGQTFIYVINTYSQFFCLLFLFILSIVILTIIVKTNKKALYSLLISLAFINVLIYGYYFVDNLENEEATSIITQEVIDNLELPNDGYNYMDNTSSLNVNYPYMLGVPSMENRLHFIKFEEINFSNKLGYYGFDTFIYSRGGTLFSNLLMQNKYYLSYIKLDERLYNLIDSYKSGDRYYYLYEAKYNLNYVVPYSGKIVEESSNVLIDNNNLLYRELFNKEEDIMNLVEGDEITLTNDNVYYFYSYSGFTYKLFDLIEEQDDKYYRNSYVSYDKYISEIIVKDDKVKLDISEYDDLRVAYINIDEFIKFVDSIDDYSATSKITNNTKVYTYEANEDTSLLIPVNYDESLIVKVNGKKVDYKLNAYNMLSIDVKKGNNEIVVSYQPKFLKEGALISLGSLILLIFVYFTNKKFKYLDKKFILYPLFGITCLIGFVFILKIYILFWL